MLEQIYDENWSELKVHTGSAEHVPEAVFGLLSDNISDFETAYWKLDNYVVVQGNLFSSAAVLPKYLEEIVVQTKFKEQVIDLIWQIGSGYSTDPHLEKKCFNEALRTLENLKTNPEVSTSKYLEIIEGEINELRELKKGREKKHL